MQMMGWPMTAVAWGLALGMGTAQAEQAKPVPPAMDPAKEAAMAAMQQYGSPGEGHKPLQSFAGEWTYTAQWRMSPEAPPESMAGTSASRLIYGGRFLQQEFRGEAEGHAPFEGTGLIGYDNLRQEYQSVWFDNMGTGLMMSTGRFDPAANTLTEQGDFSCPLTGETHRSFRAVWTIVDPGHTTYETYMRAPDGREFKAMEIHYTRISSG